jgi:hypothetical protein
VANQPHYGRPRIAYTERNKEKINDLIRQNRRVKVGKMVTARNGSVRCLRDAKKSGSTGFRAFFTTYGIMS